MVKNIKIAAAHKSGAVKYFTEGSGKLTIDKQKGAKMQDESKKTHEVSDEINASKSYFEIVDYLMKYTLLPRMVIVMIYHYLVN